MNQPFLGLGGGGGKWSNVLRLGVAFYSILQNEGKRSGIFQGLCALTFYTLDWVVLVYPYLSCRRGWWWWWWRWWAKSGLGPPTIIIKSSELVHDYTPRQIK